MKNSIVYADNILNNRPTSSYDLNMYITLDLLDTIAGGSKNVGNEIKSKQVFVDYFKYAVPKLFKQDSRFYVDYEHDGDKTKKGRISKSGHSSSESRYIVLFAKNTYGFVINSWIIDLRIGEHDSPKQIDKATGIDLRESSRQIYLNDPEQFGANLHIDTETFEKIAKTFKDIVVKCGVTPKSNVTVNLPDAKSKRCKNVDQALKFIDAYRDDLYKTMSENIDVFYYKGYGVRGNETACTVLDSDDRAIQSNITMEAAKSFIDNLTKNSKVYDVYGSQYLSSHFFKSDLFDFADCVIQEVSKYITDPTYYIIWRDIYFEYDFEILIIDVIDSDGVSYNADINIELKDFTSKANYREQCIMELVDQITDAYSSDEIG